METFTSELVIDRPRPVVYEHLQRFEDYPEFMESAEEVQPVGDDRLRWKTKIGPVTREYDAEITARQPNELISWRGMGDDVKEAGEMRLEDAGDNRTKVRFSIAYDLDSVVLQTAAALGVARRRAEQDLERLKGHIEQSA